LRADDIARTAASTRRSAAVGARAAARRLAFPARWR